MRTAGDLRDDIFAPVMKRRVQANVTIEGRGVLCGMAQAGEKLNSLGAVIHLQVDDGTPVEKGQVILSFAGNPKTIALAEDLVMGCIAKPSGIATASRKAVELARGKVKIVCGAWKKMPVEMKHLVRQAIVTGGAASRIVEGPFLYLDKNYVRIFGGVAKALEAVGGFFDHVKVVQLRGEAEEIVSETEAALRGGAHVLMVDTGSPEDLLKVSRKVKEAGMRDRIQLAFAGSVKISDIPVFIEYDVDILDIGSQIIDAPLLDLKMDVVHVEEG
ncbi:MAG: quinolinate phosphoribosyl transferase [Peptococcaceae bacterium]|nr:quinolinate phosphoribosyl transferase [Peptococcaceae bacterium]MDH7525069.1 quinolinate phosphoribosyl transferase [Peptococcaceae bacterium]